MALQPELCADRKLLASITRRLCVHDAGALLSASLAVLVRPSPARDHYRAGGSAVARRLHDVHGQLHGAPQAVATGSGSRQSAFHDVTAEEVSASLYEWRVPARAYAWGCGEDGQLGCGTAGGLPAFKRASRPLAVNFSFADMSGSGQGRPGDGDSAPVRVKCGEGCTAFIDNHRRLFTCGTGWLGHPSESRLERVRLPTRVAAFTAVPVREVSFGGGFTLACSVDGATWCWGENPGMEERARLLIGGAAGHRLPGHPLGHSTREIGSSESEAAPTTQEARAGPLAGITVLPLRIAALATVPVISVAAGSAHMVALAADGRVFTWGDGTAGACGHADTRPVWLPRQVDLGMAVAEAAQAVQVATAAGGGGGRSSFHKAVDGGNEAERGEDAEDDDVNIDDRLVALVGLPCARTIAVHTGLLVPTVRATGSAAVRRRETPLSDECRASRRAATAASTGTEGSPPAAPFRVGAVSSTRVAAISAGAHHTALLTHAGRAAVMGWGGQGRLGTGTDAPSAQAQPSLILGLPTLVGVACGTAHTLLLAGDGRLYACGSNDAGQLGIHPGEAHRLGRSPGVVGLLRRESGEAPRVSPADLGPDAPAGARERLRPRPSCALRPQQVDGPEGFSDAIVVHSAAGGSSSCAIDTLGRLWTWGWAEDGNGGSGSDDSAFNPRRVARFGHLSVLQASVGPTHMAAIVTRGGGEGRGGEGSACIARGCSNGSGSRGRVGASIPGGGASSLEPPLPPHILRVRAGMMRARLLALAFARKQRIKASALIGVLSLQKAKISAQQHPRSESASRAAAPGGAAAHRRLSALRNSLAAAPLPPRRATVAATVRWWEAAPDSGAFGAHAAAAMIQRAWRGHALRTSCA
jgi:alpha-tubulin suppressor-like RCC1 family protein